MPDLGDAIVAGIAAEMGCLVGAVLLVVAGIGAAAFGAYWWLLR
jgi:hypothetical protein